MKSQRTRSVRIVLPAYNEEHTIERSFRRLHGFCTEHLNDYEWEILVVSNGSSDLTADLATRLVYEHDRARCLSLPVAGRGGALRRAAEMQQVDYLLYMDVDLSTDLNAMPRLLDELDRGADVAIGSRHLPESRVQRRIHRTVLSRGYNLLLKALFRVTTFRDAQCGFKAFRLDRLKALLALAKDRRWFFDTEVLVLAEYSGLRVAEIPVAWTENPDSRVDVPVAIAQKLIGMARLKLTAKKALNGTNLTLAGR